MAERHEAGQPVLIGTASVAKSEVLSTAAQAGKGVKHEVLNAKQHEREAARSSPWPGQKGAVTVVDQHGRPRHRHHLGRQRRSSWLTSKLHDAGIDPVEHSEEYEEQLPGVPEDVRGADRVPSTTEVVEAGGLYVVGSERHESRRIDNQLRGRSGRQGDPGESRFYLSLGDDLMRLFKSDIVEWVLNALNIPDDQPIENKRVSSSIASAQAQVESQNFETRKNILKYDDVMNRQRHAVYGDRRKVLEGADISDRLRTTVDTVVEQYVVGATAGFAEDWDLEQLWTSMNTLYPVGLDRAKYDDDEDLDQATLIADFKADAERAYDAREAELGAEVMREVERRVLLTVLDRKWREHLYEMDYLREGIGLRAMAQRDPLVEYQREGGDMFNSMMEAFMEEVVGFVFHLDVTVDPVEPAAPQVGVVAGADGRAMQIGSRGSNGAAAADADEADSNGSNGHRHLVETGPDPDGPGVEVTEVEELDEPELETAGSRPRVRAKGLEQPARRRLTYTSPDESGEATAEAAAIDDPYAGVGRNAPCPCGSGKKFKMCHGRTGS